jgi:hypothetical protein
MGKVNRYTYYRKDRDLVMWGHFDTLVFRLRTTTSSALTEAAREYLAAHKDDPTPEAPVPPMTAKQRAGIPSHDPFA